MTDRAGAFARLFTTAREGIFIGTIGPDGGSTTAANPHLKQLLGYALDAPDAGVRPFAADRFSDPLARRAFLERLNEHGGVSNHVLHLRREDDTPIWVEVSASFTGRAAADDPASADGASREREIAALIRDIGEQRRQQDQSRDLYHQLQQAEKMAALGQTISSVAHELNNPLATILSWAERLAESPADDKTRRGLEVIRSESERAARIVRNLLTFARKRQTTRMMVDLNDVVRETLALRAYEQRVTNIDVVQTLARQLPLVFADAHQIKQVALNLIINAEQAMITAHGRGTMHLRTWHDTDRNSVVLEVHDDGPGVPEERRSRIFDPFFTTKEAGKGTGLGLSVACAIVQEHGGRIWLTSEGRGASFFVELPGVGQQLLPPRQPPPAIDLEVFRGLRVLVVEDEPALAAAVCESLTDAGCVVKRAGDGEEGLIRLSEDTFDLVVCDLKMPRIDGMQFYRAMAAAAPALARRVIFVTGAVAGSDAERFFAEIGCRWLAKPFRLGDLLRAARDAVA